MTYREKNDTELYAEHLRDIVLKRHSALGPWLVIGLVTTLVLFLSYLVYSNVLGATTVVASPERSLRMMDDGMRMTTAPVPAQSSSALVPPWTSDATRVPQSRATHALVGGEGPALLPARLSVTSNSRRSQREMY